MKEYVELWTFVDMTSVEGLSTVDKGNRIRVCLDYSVKVSSHSYFIPLMFGRKSLRFSQLQKERLLGNKHLVVLLMLCKTFY